MLDKHFNKNLLQKYLTVFRIVVNIHQISKILCEAYFLGPNKIRSTAMCCRLNKNTHGEYLAIVFVKIKR